MNSQHHSAARLLKATMTCVAAAAILLLTAVLPAEYGIDPTGVGKRLGLVQMAQAAEAAPTATPVLQPAAVPASAENANLARQAVAAFGKQQPGQTLDATAVARAAAAERTDTLTLTLPPGKGAEVKALIDAGQGFVFHWSASGPLLVDMHGETPDAKDEYTSYWIEGAQREGAGTFVAKFSGKHGWYWKNKGTESVTVKVTVTGFQTQLSRPGH